jgi:hypothetical protein
MQPQRQILARPWCMHRGFPTPFTRRKAWLPPRFVEQFYHKVLGPVAALSYLYSDPTQLGMSMGPADRAVCKAYEPAIQQAKTGLLDCHYRLDRVLK